MQKAITVLGCTGSIGVSTLDVIRRHPDKYRLFALGAHQQIERLWQQCCEFRPQFAVLKDEQLAQELASRLQADGIATQVLVGVAGLVQVASAPEVDMVMAAIVGAAGLAPTMAAVQAGKRILLANKESLVMAGHLFIEAVANSGAELLPVDSEHNAIFQALPHNFVRGGQEATQGVKRILLTASGGPFRNTPLAQLQEVTPEQACAHPNWAMGRKISVDSATMMNKGLELIEAYWLFGLPAEQIQVVVHPQSVIHSMVEYADGSVLAQMGNPDMRTPIAYALAWPERIDAGVNALDLFKIGQLNFVEPDFVRFPCLRLAYDALTQGGSAPAILNAANEVAVAAFLAGQLSFLGIPQLIASTMERLSVEPIHSLEHVMAIDQQAREIALQLLADQAV